MSADVPYWRASGVDPRRDEQELRLESVDHPAARLHLQPYPGQWPVLSVVTIDTSVITVDTSRG